MEFKIIRATAQIGQIEVEYTKDGSFVGVYAIDVPIVEGQFLTGEALTAEILLRAPSWETQRKAEIAGATNFAEIEALVQEPEPTPYDIDEEANARMWEQVEYEKKLAAALVKFGILQSDPTTVEVTQL